MSAVLAFDQLDLSDEHRALIVSAIPNSPRAYLALLDKGLSGAEVWRVRWQLPGSGTLSALHVFKIGDASKLQREYEAIQGIAAAIDPEVTYVELVGGASGGELLLRQHFAGDSFETVTSLRSHLRSCSSGSDAVECIERLYLDRMRRWHPKPVAPQTLRHESYRAALDWWVGRADLKATAGAIGLGALDSSLSELVSVDFDDIVSFRRELEARESDFAVGPVHGDLHAQNVLIDEVGRLHLIDYGWCAERWRAIDFLMMECSIKFVATPVYCRLHDLVELDRILALEGGAAEITKACTRMLFGAELERLFHVVLRVRELALQLGAVRDRRQYMEGLAVLTAGLTSIPYEINHAYLFHSFGMLCGVLG